MSAREELFDLRGDVAVVIGASGTLGGAMASGLAAAGARVAVVGRSRERGEARVRSVREAGGVAQFFRADATVTDDLRRAREEIVEALGEPTVLVNAAGGNDAAVTVSDSLRFEEIDVADWRRNFDLNLVGGAVFPCQVFGPPMVERGRGSIINIASVSAHLPLSRVVSYSAAKAAVLNLTRFLAREWGARGVRVNSITPGFFPAEQNRRLLVSDDGTPTERGQAVLSHTPMGRFGDPQELVGAVVFLASERASGFVNGADLPVDGGFLSQTI